MIVKFFLLTSFLNIALSLKVKRRPDIVKNEGNDSKEARDDNADNSDGSEYEEGESGSGGEEDSQSNSKEVVSEEYVDTSEEPGLTMEDNSGEDYQEMDTHVNIFGKKGIALK